jgi:hypothetical protein
MLGGHQSIVDLDFILLLEQDEGVNTIKDTPDMQYQIAFKTDCSSRLYHIAVL